MKKLIALIALIGAITAQAQETLFFQGTEHIVHQVGKKVKSFNNGPVIGSWFKYQSRIEDRYIMELVEVHCPSGKYRIITNASYVNGGHLSTSWRDPNPIWHDAIPYTLGAAYSNIC